MSKIAPSLLASDFLRLDREIERFKECGAQILHLDIMDGRFVPNMTFGWPLVQMLRPLLPGVCFDTHLMMQEPLRVIAPFCKAGADVLTVHVECADDVSACIDEIKSHGVVPGLSIKPGTPPEALFPWLGRIGHVLVMTVEPGFGGQKLIWECVDKISSIKAEAYRQGNSTLTVAVDGGVYEENCAAVAKAGADILVAGSAVFGSDDMTGAFARLSAAVDVELV